MRPLDRGKPLKDEDNKSFKPFREFLDMCEAYFTVYTRKNVKNWNNGTMVQRWVSAAMLDAERRAHRIEGYRSMNVLIAEIKRLTTTIEMGHVENTSMTV